MAIIAVAGIGLVVPVVHSHCLSESSSGLPKVESSWGFNWYGGGFPNPAPDGQGCVRNTLTREGLDLFGVWSLGSPEHQIAEKLVE